MKEDQKSSQNRALNAMKAVMGVQKVFMALQVLRDNWYNNYFNYSIPTLETSLLEIIFHFPFYHLWPCKMFNVSDQKWSFRCSCKYHSTLVLFDRILRPFGWNSHAFSQSNKNVLSCKFYWGETKFFFISPFVLVGQMYGNSHFDFKDLKYLIQ